TLALKDKCDAVRRDAAEALARTPTRSEKVARALRESLNDSSPWARHNAAQALACIDPETLDGLTMLLDDMHSGDKSALSALGALAFYGPRAKAGLDTFLKALRVGGGFIYAPEVLGLIGPDAKKAVPALEGLLN